MNKVTREDLLNLSKTLLECIEVGVDLKGFWEKFKRFPRRIRKRVVAKTRNGRTALAMASVKGNCELVKYLVEECSADIEQKSTNPSSDHTPRFDSTPLWWVCNDKNLKMVKFLLNLGANVNSLSEFGSTPLLHACSMEDYDTIRYLLEQGADIQKTNNRGETCLTAFVNELVEWDNNAADTIKLLLDNGVAPFAKTCNGDDALQIAAVKGLDTVVNQLMGFIDCTAEKKAELNELLGVFHVFKDDRKGILHWKEALNIRSNEGNYIRKRPEMPIPTAYGNIVEFTTIEELDAIAFDKNAYRLQGMLICERILGIDHPHTMDLLKCVAFRYYPMSQIQMFLELWLMVVQRQLKKDSILRIDSCFQVQAILPVLFSVLHNKSYQMMLRFEQLFSVFQLLASRMAEAYQKSMRKSFYQHFDFVVQYLPNLIDSLLVICKNDQEREWIKEPIRKLIQSGVRQLLTGDTLLHIAVVSMKNVHEAENKWTAVVKFLLECGAHIDLPNRNGVRPLDLLANIQQNDIPFQHYISLQCICANDIISSGISYRNKLPKQLKDFVRAHEAA